MVANADQCGHARETATAAAEATLPAWSVSAVGLIWQQDAFAAGPLAASMTALVITDPVVGFVVGVAGFSEHVPTSAGATATAVAGALVTIAGVYALARSQSSPPTTAPAVS